MTDEQAAVEAYAGEGTKVLLPPDVRYVGQVPYRGPDSILTLGPREEMLARLEQLRGEIEAESERVKWRLEGLDMAIAAIRGEQ